MGAALLLASSSFAAEAKDTCEWGKNRELKGHRFAFTRFTDTAFILTSMSLRLGVEAEQTKDFPTTFGPIDLTQVRGATSLDLSLRLHDRFGVFGVLRGDADVGSNTPSLVLRGSQYAYEGGGGVMVRILTAEETGTQVSMRAGVSAGDGQRLSLLPLLGQFADRPVFTVADMVNGNLGNLLLTPVSTFRTAAAVTVAQSIGPVLGLQGAARIDHRMLTFSVFDVLSNERREVDGTITTPALSAGLSFDASPLGVPVALVPEARLSYVRTDSPINRNDRSEFEADGALGIMYSGRSDFEVGVTLTGSLNREKVEGTNPDGSPAVSQAPRAAGGELAFRYIW